VGEKRIVTLSDVIPAALDAEIKNRSADENSN
jgi:hypothetical protein